MRRKTTASVMEIMAGKAASTEPTLFVFVFGFWGIWGVDLIRGLIVLGKGVG